MSCSFLPSPAGELAVFWDLITGSLRAFQPITGLLQAAGRVTAACGDEQQLPCMVAVPSGRPMLLGLLCIFLSKTCLIPILHDQIANGEDTAGEMIKDRGLCSQGGGQKAQQLSWRWCLLPATPGASLHSLNNDLVILLTLIKSTWCADSSGPGGDLFGLRQPC